MAFDVSTVTLKGAELLAAATAQNRLIIDGCDADTAILTQAQAAQISARPASPLSTTTDVTQLGSNTGHVNSRVYFWAGTNPGGDAHSLYLYAHSESDPSNVYVIFVASATDSFHIPEPGDVVNEYQAALDIVYTVATDSVGYATQATYCSLSEFNLLKERTVTTHKEGELTTGESQDVYGTKTFKDQVIASALDVTGPLTVWETSVFMGDMNAGAITANGNVSVNGSKLTAFNDLVVKGNITANTTNKTASFCKVSVSDMLESYGPVFVKGSSGLCLDQTATFCAEDDANSSYDEIITVNSGQTATNRVNIKNVKDITAGNARINSACTKISSTDREFIAQNTTDPTNAAVVIKDCKVSAYSVSATNGISCPTDIVSGLGVSVGASGLTGLHPTASSGTVNVPIGGIVAVYASSFVIGQGSSLNTVLVGDVITVGSSESIYAAKWNSDSGEWEQGKQLPSNASYVALSDASSLSGTTFNGMLLVVRTA